MVGWAAQVRKLKTLLRRHGRSHADAEDLVQEAFLRLHQFLKEGHPVERPEAFLIRTALNLSVDLNRQDLRDHRHEFEPQTIEDMTLIDSAPSPEEIYSAEKRLNTIGTVLERQVGARAREVFLLHRLYGLTHEEIAARMNMTLRTVEKDIARAVTAIWMERNKE